MEGPPEGGRGPKISLRFLSEALVGCMPVQDVFEWQVVGGASIWGEL